MAHTLALICTSSRGLWSRLERLRRALPAMLVTAVTLLDSHGVAAAVDVEHDKLRTAREHVVAQLHDVPEDALRRQYLRCAFASNERLLAPDESILCVLVADVLLARAFGGDFAALIAWYQRNREPAVALERR